MLVVTMPIKLKIPKAKSTEELRAEHIERHNDVTSRLEKTLRNLIDPHRDQYQKLIADSKVYRVQTYMDKREDGQTIEEYCRKQFKESPMWRAYAAEVRDLLRKLTDYDDRLTMATWDSRAGKYSTFEVNLKKTHKAIAYKLAHPEVEQIIQTFLYRAKDKLVDLMIAYPDYEAKLISGGFANNLFQGKIDLRFKRPDLDDKIETKVSTFIIRFGVKWNTSVYGNPYPQYPFTFHDYVVETTVPDMDNRLYETTPKALSEQSLQNWFKFDAWMPPKQQTSRFKSVGTGSIIVNKTGQIALCIRTGSDNVTKEQHAVVAVYEAGKLKKADWKADSIVKAVAEIKHVNAGYKDQPSTCMAYFEKGVERMDMGIPPESYRGLSYGRCEQDIREKVFVRLVEEKKVIA